MAEVEQAVRQLLRLERTEARQRLDPLLDLRRRARGPERLGAAGRVEVAGDLLRARRHGAREAVDGRRLREGHSERFGVHRRDAAHVEVAEALLQLERPAEGRLGEDALVEQEPEHDRVGVVAEELVRVAVLRRRALRLEPV